MGRQMFGMSLHNHIVNQTLHQTGDVKNIIVATAESKMRWARHFARFADNWCTFHIIEWYSRKRKLPLGLPPKRWRSYVEEMVGRGCKRIQNDSEQLCSACGSTSVISRTQYCRPSDLRGGFFFNAQSVSVAKRLTDLFSQGENPVAEMFLRVRTFFFLFFNFVFLLAKGS